jgi:hypothetical protein
LNLKILNESGFKEAMIGLSLNKNQPIENMPQIARKLSKLGKGHDNFMESMYVWLDVKAPRYWWAEADRYRLSTKQSESTMHTVLKRELKESDFEDYITDKYLENLNFHISVKDLLKLKTLLPEGFLQRRIWVMSYKTLQNIIIQRYHHRLPHWRIFCEQIKKQVDHPELLPFEEVENRREEKSE